MRKPAAWLAFIALVFISISSIAQEATPPTKGYKYNNNFDLALSANRVQYSGALSWIHFHPITPNKALKLGYGVRFTAQKGRDLNYTTAPAILTSKMEGPHIIATKIYDENIDTLLVTSAQNNALNLTFNIQYTFRQKLDVGFNIDVIGFTVGKRVTGRYISPQDPGNPEIQAAKPTPFNLLLISDNDFGTLNSEFFLRYWFTPKWGVKGGATFLFTEYTTDNRLRLENNRWRNKAWMGLLGITFCPYR